ncbi:hypothetical protein [Candidatus Nesciobacter abundans]|uniref:Uncharacterized protein n=1 Tax=Candidatus Nesciobacter abundans TaxID=2601668 RepID=A0A5C0UGA2_9PROT|nr:hypothetical protein [Candidatus Nesciobacter abundans]QEK39135.1 hypothetical protein FZC36_01655 [Candidatus Nesciobacter abundans]
MIAQNNNMGSNLGKLENNRIQYGDGSSVDGINQLERQDSGSDLLIRMGEDTKKEVSNIEKYTCFHPMKSYHESFTGSVNKDMSNPNKTLSGKVISSYIEVVVPVGVFAMSMEETGLTNTGIKFIEVVRTQIVKKERVISESRIFVQSFVLGSAGQLGDHVWLQLGFNEVHKHINQYDSAGNPTGSFGYAYSNEKGTLLADGKLDPYSPS